jgi:hypothetical protein
MKKITTYEWLKSHVNYNDSKCLIYPYSKNWDGYGRTYHNGKYLNSHRVMCTLAHGQPPSDKHHAAHKCGVTSCVNPSHLYWATPSENQKDNVKAGTHRNYVLSPGLKKFAIQLIDEGRSQLEVSQIVGVNPRTIRNLIEIASS